jgi:hypothetical protein
MTPQHKELAAGRWLTLSLVEQLANAGSEVERAVGWQRKGNADLSLRAAERALELLDLTISDAKNRGRLRELCRVRETVVDYFFGDNSYRSTAQSWHRYFFPFAVAARAGR